ncbi:hypothetical protein SAMN05444972_1111 [Marininema halotolerans]|uniref:Uncharacterized protein n=1 Tax=Marininema halotolerans TaxID=1155944 RepID=A0A1I6TR42_9BACL|nr:hypothetical protein SAMN05444972_1111 [Marininema halotolerans]
MRRSLPEGVYVWINAYKDRANYYTEEDRRQLGEIDPLFEYNRQDYESYGKRCGAGEHVFYLS